MRTVGVRKLFYKTSVPVGVGPIVVIVIIIIISLLRNWVHVVLMAIG